MDPTPFFIRVKPKRAGILQTRKLEASRKKPNYNQLIFSILNAIFFLPLFLLWMPAMIYSLQIARNGSKNSKAKTWNIACLITGNC
jgi:hypothetical protein